MLHLWAGFERTSLGDAAGAGEHGAEGAFVRERELVGVVVVVAFAHVLELVDLVLDPRRRPPPGTATPRRRRANHWRSRAAVHRRQSVGRP